MSRQCFRDLEKDTAPVGIRSSLGDWYDSVCSKPIADFNADDICRLCRQEIHVGYVVPVALSMLTRDIEAGHQYDGELASALSRVSQSFWNAHRELARQLANVLTDGLDAFDEDIRQEVKAFLDQYA